MQDGGSDTENELSTDIGQNFNIMSRVLRHQKRDLNNFAHIFEVMEISGINGIIHTESKKTENRYNCRQTGSSYISGNRRAR